jgi:hypothetical protein
MTFGDLLECGKGGRGLDMTGGTTKQHKELSQASIASPWISAEQMSEEAENDDASPNAKIMNICRSLSLHVRSCTMTFLLVGEPDGKTAIIVT